MSGIYQVYTIIINFLGFPDADQICHHGRAAGPQAQRLSTALAGSESAADSEHRDAARQH